jgi:hypothetical protein
MQTTTTASDLAALHAALARDALAQARAERRATLQSSCAVGPAARYATCKPGLQVASATRFVRALSLAGEALL